MSSAGRASQCQSADGQMATDLSTSSICSMVSVAWRPRASKVFAMLSRVGRKPNACKDRDLGAMDLLLAQRAEQSNHTRQVLAWLHRQPLARTLALRQIMEPILNLIKNKVYQGSLQYQLHQQLEELKALQAGVTELDCASNNGRVWRWVQLYGST